MSLRQDILNCRACNLWNNYKQCVPFEGNEHAELMFIGRDPGSVEVELVRPFVGPAGQVFRQEVLASIGIKEEDVYISNIVCCRPLNNIPPPANAAWVCAERHVSRAVNEIKPRVIVTLGKEATEYTLGYTIKSMGRTRGLHYTLSTRFSPIPIVPTWHPSYILRLQSISPSESVTRKNEMIKDIRSAMKYCENLELLV
jgi:uracil-DNA glycosylase family 4